jgi:hypothetical protein
MSLHSTSRGSTLRQGLVVLATAATLLAGGLVAAPAAQAAPVVDTSERAGTAVTTRMNAKGGLISGNPETDFVSPGSFRYWVDLGWTGGELDAFDGVVTLQRVGATQVRRFPVTLDAQGDRTRRIDLPATLTPGSYRVGIEFTATVQRPDGQLIAHEVDVNNAKTVPILAETRIEASITNPTDTDGRPSRIRGKVSAIHVGDNGDVTWERLRSGTVRLSFDPDGPYTGSEKPVHVRDVSIGSLGWFTTTVPARQGWWPLDYAGTDRNAGTVLNLRQGEHEGCGC